MPHTKSHTLPDVTVRLAHAGDSIALLRLASLDSAAVPAKPVVLAESGGELVAAVAVDGSGAIADPFRRTAALLDMLELRAAQLRAGGPTQSSRRGWGQTPQHKLNERRARRFASALVR